MIFLYLKRLCFSVMITPFFQTKNFPTWYWCDCYWPGKKKGYEDLIPWIRSICNHIWFCASTCEKDADLLVEMWKSILFHIRNIHSFPGEKYLECNHGPLDSEAVRKKKWLKEGRKSYQTLEKIVNDSRILKDLRQPYLFCHTGCIEVYHSMMLKYVPKKQEFQYPQMVARTQLAALDHNFNLKRKHKQRSDGQHQFVPICPKSTGQWIAKKRYEEKDYIFRTEIMELVIEQKANNEIQTTAHQEKKKVLPRNIASTPAPSKSELVEAHVSRFKINQ